MTDGARKIPHPRRYSYEIFKSEMGIALKFINRAELSRKTGLSYIKVWRLSRGIGDWKSDDLIKVAVALGRVDILNSIIRAVKKDIKSQSR